jgi:predicted nucleic acid-binding protein
LEPMRGEKCVVDTNSIIYYYAREREREGAREREKRGIEREKRGIERVMCISPTIKAIFSPWGNQCSS